MEKPYLVHHFLEESAGKYPDKTALIHEKNRITYNQINEYSNQLAGFIISAGVKKGDCVVFIIENSLEYVVAYYGIQKAGAIAVPMSTEIKPDGLKPLLDELNPAVILCASRFEKVLYETDLSGCPLCSLVIIDPKQAVPAGLKSVEWRKALDGRAKTNINLDINPSDISSIIYTSGSTGRPKGVTLLHKNITANTISICRYLKLTDKDIQMIVLPFFYVMGKSLLNTHFAAGGTVVINNKFAFPASVINQMIEEKVTGFSGVPSTYAYLLHRSPLEKRRNELVSLRYCSQAGGHMSRQIKEELRRVLPDHTDIVIMYGATEAAARLTYLDPEMFKEKIESIGKEIPDVTMKVIKENGEDAKIDEVGELVGAGDNIMRGYWKDPEATAKVLDKNGYHTGDLGYRDKDGFLFLVGRRDNLLKAGGHRINPQEIEDVLMATGLIIEAAVIGIPDELLGNRLVAVVTPLKEDVTADYLMSCCARKLPKYKLPGTIKLVRALPKNASGKVIKAKCLDMIN